MAQDITVAAMAGKVGSGLNPNAVAFVMPGAAPSQNPAPAPAKPIQTPQRNRPESPADADLQRRCTAREARPKGERVSLVDFETVSTIGDGLVGQVWECPMVHRVHSMHGHGLGNRGGVAFAAAASTICSPDARCTWCDVSAMINCTQ